MSIRIRTIRGSTLGARELKWQRRDFSSGSISEVGLRNRHVRFPPVSDQKVDMATLAHAYATCAIAFFKVSALSSKARASSSDISGQNTSLTPARPTTLGGDRVTP